MSDYAKLKIPELKQLLRKRGLEAIGRKQLLIDALEADDAESGVEPAPNGSASDDKNNNTSKKRTASEAAFEDSGAKQAKSSISNDVSQYANSTMHIPLEENCHLIGYSVYIDASNIVWDAALNQTDSSNNHNKFYRIQILQSGSDFRTWTRWGRVAENGQSAFLGNGSLPDALKNFETKFKSKTGLSWSDRGGSPKAGKYVFVEKNCKLNIPPSCQSGTGLITFFRRHR